MNLSEINRITGARVVENHVLELQFSDGFLGRLDMTPALWGPVFGPLKHTDYFRQFRLEDDTIRWPNDADFCPDVLRYWCEAGGVRSQEETDSHFVQQLTERAAS
ncbi:MAG: DUF2442 domain-containing protein [Pirellulales bacterium]